MGRTKKVLKEIELDTLSEASDVETSPQSPPPEPKRVSKKTKKAPSLPKVVEEESGEDEIVVDVATRPALVKKALSEKKMKALQLANKARLRQQIEREVEAENRAMREESKRMEKKVLALIRKHVPKASKHSAPQDEESSDEESVDLERTPPPKSVRAPKRAKRAHVPRHHDDEEYEPQPYQVNPPAARMVQHVDPTSVMFSKIFG